MHSIERYGIVALLFLVVTVIAVLMWDGKKHKKNEALAGSSVTRPAAAPPVDARASENRLTLLSDGVPGPLSRTLPPAAEKPLDAETAHAGQALSAGGEPSKLAPGASRPTPAVETQTPREEPAQEPVISGAPAASAATHAYVLRAGDTLSEIALRELGSARRWSEIVSANPGLDPALLQIGKTIQIPGQGPATRAAAAEPPTHKTDPAPAKGKAARTWTVAAGESLWTIAERALGSGSRWREIAALNPKVNPDRLAKGQVLALPGTAGGEKRAATKPSSAKQEPLVASSAGSARSTGGGKVK